MFWTSVHKDITTRLERQNRALYREVQRVLRTNKAERHLRGGMATRHKYHPEALDENINITSPPCTTGS